MHIFPKSMYNIGQLNRQLNKGDILFQQKGNLVANVWRDNRLVYVMFNNTTGDDSTVCQRKEKNGSISTIPIPLNNFPYNKYMGGVDTADQFRSYYQWKLESRKFYL